MPKFYVESGPIRLILDATTAEDAAVKAFQWTCDKQAEIQAESPLDHMLEAEERGWQLWDEISVNEQDRAATCPCRRSGGKEADNARSSRSLKPIERERPDWSSDDAERNRPGDGDVCGRCPKDAGCGF